jgi:hypothetical protein
MSMEKIDPATGVSTGLLIRSQQIHIGVTK